MDPSIQELLDETNDTLKSVKELIEVKSSEWQTDLNSLQEEVRNRSSNGDPVDTEALKAGLQGIIDQKFAEEKANGLLASAVRDNILADPWSKEIDYLETMSIEPKMLTEAESKEAFLHSMNVLASAEPKDDCHRNWARLSFDAMLLDKVAQLSCIRGSRQYKGLHAEYPNFAKAWATQTSKFIKHFTGKAALDPMDLTDMAYWVPTGWAMEVREIIQINLVVANLFQRFRMPQDPFKFPINLTDSEGNYIPEVTAYTNPYAAADPTQLGQALTDAEATFAAKKIRARLITSGELNENAAVAMLPLMRNQIFKILGNSEESALLNGDTAAASSALDDDITQYDCRAAIDGIRLFCQGASSMVDAGGTLTVAQLTSTVRKSMGEYGVDHGGNLVWIAGPSSYLRCLGLTNFLTVDKYGPAATALTGELGRVGGLPVVVSRKNRELLETTGLYLAAGTQGSTVMTLVRKDAFLIGDKRDVTLEVVRLPQTDQHDIIGMQRLDFQNMFGTGYPTAAVLHNIPN